MIQITKLRLNGFKSFVDKTELDIQTGLTGIVGPNGCGKSNLVEALRWVMGENSARRMRGGGMDDVIFAGTSERPARSLAEVSLVLDNAEKTAPAGFNGYEDIEVVRKIQRDQGSSYRINGQPVRAHDVQLLFADIMSGANSPALVSQGQVTRIITAKPIERRLVLEESAGIGGLYARRHEAELRLKAADENLARVEDVLGGMETRLAGLKKQARQASRYRNISALVRQLEVSLAWLEWRAVQDRAEAARKRLAEAESSVAGRTESVVQLTRTQAAQAVDLPDLRQKDADAAAKIQTLRLNLQRLEDEARQADILLKEAGDQLSQLRADIRHETLSQEDIATLLGKLDAEQAALEAGESGEQEDLERKRMIRDGLEASSLKLENDYAAMMESVATLRARRESLQRRLEADRALLEAAGQRMEATRKSLEIARDALGAESRAQELGARISANETALETRKARLRDFESRRKNLAAQQEQAREQLQESARHSDSLSTEINTLELFFKEDSQGEFLPVMDDLEVREGFETALSKALGDSLEASLDEDAPSVWLEARLSGHDPALPDGCEPLASHVLAGADRMAIALSQIGIVESVSAAAALRHALKPGQALVTRDGAYWRWDGFHIKASAADRNALRLREKKRLAELKSALPASLRRAAKAGDAFSSLRDRLELLDAEIASQISEISSEESALGALRREFAGALESRGAAERELARLEESATLLSDEHKRLQYAVAGTEREIAELPGDEIEEKLGRTEALREELREVRDRLRAAVRAYDLGRQQQDSRKARLHAIADERLNLHNRAIRSKERIKALEGRDKALAERLDTLKSRPGTIGADRQKLLDALAESERERSVSAEKLAQRERELAETGSALRSAEAELAGAREERASAGATLAALDQRTEEVRREIAEKFETAPESLASQAALAAPGSDPQDQQTESSLEELRRRLERLLREREAIGPVNLCADTEAQQLEVELAGLLNERNDLIAAIAELRQGISKLNTEARQRLSAAFGHVNAHFASLFSRLYGGGSAHLALIESEDPLEAGLEIFAQPPGKTLQSITLLSGGEQTLAAIALIFAMFLTNPSPICVLDEIDAPLDDANVDRVCDLLDEIAEAARTRFLVITHHRLTMARMDRLYGVTMAERGVSQLVSVDLQQSFEFMEAAE